MPQLRADRPGIALLVVLLMTMVIAAIGANTFLINEYDSQSSLLESTADAGLELGRARLNANPALYDPTAPATLELDAAVYDASGAVVPGLTRTVYSMPLGGGLGEYGNFAALVAITKDREEILPSGVSTSSRRASPSTRTSRTSNRRTSRSATTTSSTAPSTATRTSRSGRPAPPSRARHHRRCLRGGQL